MGRTLLICLASLCLCSCRPETSQRSSNSAPRALPSGSVSPNGPILSYANVVDRVAPAVVTIHSSKRERAPQQFPFFDDPFFRQFFGGGTPRNRGGETQREALGSGVIVRPDGHILTNYHVIDGAQDIKVEVTDQRTYTATVVGSDAPSDLAVLKVAAGNLPILQLGDSDRVRVGDVVLAVGNPLGVGKTVTTGIISAKGRATGVSDGSFQDFLQTDASINQGNSGGALVNTRAELIGINSQILSTNGGNIGIGFAIPSNMAKGVMNQLIGRGKVQRGMLGVGVQTVNNSIAQALGLKEVRGVLINSVSPGKPADRAGLKTGDVIIKFNGHDVNDSNLLRNEIAATSPGTDVNLTILRDGKTQDVHVRLEELTPQSAQDQSSPGGGPSGDKLGITIAPLTPALARELGIKAGTQGVVITDIDPSGPAAQAGIQAGDVIQEVNRQAVRSAADVQNALRKSGGRPPLLLINRGGQTVYVPVPLS
jgi:serine protease Do